MRSPRAAAVALALTACNFRTLNAIPWAEPEPTAVDKANERGWNPKPTSSPFGDFANLGATQVDHLFGLKRRQDGLDICGWQDQISSMPVYCDFGYECAQDAYNYGAGCCTTAADLNSCYLPTECQPYNPTSSFTPQTLSNLYTTFCDNLTPYCFVRSYLFSSDQQTFYEVGCTTLSQTDQTVYDSYSGQTTGLSSTPNIVTISVTQPNVNNGGPLAGSTSTAGGAANGSNNGGGGGSNTGAIVGGVVGGLGGLALIIGIIVICCLRRRKKERKEKSKTTNYNESSHAQSHTSQQQYHYAPLGPNPHSQPPMAQYTSTAGVYDPNEHSKGDPYSSATSNAGSYNNYAPTQPQQPTYLVPGDYRQQQYHQPQTPQHQSTIVSPYLGGSPGGSSDRTSGISPNLTNARLSSTEASRLGSPAPTDAGGSGGQLMTDAGAAGATDVNRRVVETSDSERIGENQSNRQRESIPGMPASWSQPSRDETGYPSAMTSPNLMPSSDGLGGTRDRNTKAVSHGDDGTKTAEWGHGRDEAMYHEMGS